MKFLIFLFLCVVVFLTPFAVFADCSPCKKTGETTIRRKDGTPVTIEICDCRGQKQQNNKKA